MSEVFAVKLELTLKALSLSRGRLAADLGVDKSVVGRWVTGAVKPSAHNLVALTAYIATRVPGFAILDWDRDLDGLARVLGADPAGINGSAGGGAFGALPLRYLPEIMATTATRGASYEGFFRTTRPFAAQPGRFIHDQCMIRKDPGGLLRLRLGTWGVFVEGWVLPLNAQVFFIGSQLTSGSLVFGVFNGSPALSVDLVDGIMLSAILDIGQTPTATACIFERIGFLSDDPQADDLRFEEAATHDPLAPEASISPNLANHLARDIGPTQMAIGGDWLLQMPLKRSVSR